MNQGMKRKMIGLALLGSSVFAQAGTMGQSYEPWYANFEISGAGGPNWFNTNNDTRLVISPFETDSLRVRNIQNNGTWKVGVGYFLDSWLSAFSVPYLNHFLFEANVYQITGAIHGDVWQFELPEFNNYRFRAPFTSTRLMFDFKPYVFSWNRIAPYLILGVGPTWNTISYRERVTSFDVPEDTALRLASRTTTQVAGDVGVGLSVGLTHGLSFTAEYVYGFLGNGSPANWPTNGVLLANTPSFSFQTQSLLFGLSLRV